MEKSLKCTNIDGNAEYGYKYSIIDVYSLGVVYEELLWNAKTVKLYTIQCQ